MEVRRAGAALWLAVAVTSIGCGLLGVDEGEMRRMRDPYVGFQDGPTIEVCSSGKRIVPTSKGTGQPLSICVSKGAQARTCSDASECGSTESCVCGRCMTRPCSGATDCELHEKCNNNRCTRECAVDGDCASGETCSSGGCARLCGSHADCAFGEKCSAFDPPTCIVKTCMGTVSCTGDDDCMELEDRADLREPHVASVAGQLYAYVELRRPAAGGKVTCSIYRARVVGSRRWEVDPPGPVMEPAPEDDGCIGAPSVLAGSDVVMFASRGSGTGIVRARSSDGATFERETEDVVVPRFEWENGWVASPGATVFGSQVVLAYEADHGRAVGIATVDAAGAASVVSWLIPTAFEDPVLWRSVDRIGAPFLQVRGDALLMYLTVHGIEGYDAVPDKGVYPADPNDSIGLVESKDLSRWVRFPTGPVYARRTNLRAYLGEKDPAVVVGDDFSWLMYVGSDASGKSLTGLGLATTGP